MISQKFFNYHFSTNNNKENFFVNQTNRQAFDIVIDNNFDQNIFLFAPKKSGKSHLLSIWKEKNNALFFENNFTEIIKLNKNIAIDDIFKNCSEEDAFHLINHCKIYDLKIFVTSSVDLKDFEFKFKDLQSRLRSFYYLKINIPDDEMCKMLMTKLFLDKQIIIKHKEIFDFIFKRIDRTYVDIYSFVEKIDKLSLEKKRQLTIPLIKEIL